MPRDCPIKETIPKFCVNHCWLVQENDDTCSEVIGLVHFSDLNKHAARLYFYLWLAGIEMGLAQLISKTLGQKKDWLFDYLGKNDKKLSMILRQMEIDERKDAAQNPTGYMDLSDLIKIVGKSDKLHKQLGFISGNKWKEATSGLINLRNCIMHPVRTLVITINELESLKKRHEKMLRLAKCIHSVL